MSDARGYPSLDAAIRTVYDHALERSGTGPSNALRSASDWIVEAAAHDPDQTLSTLLLAYDTMTARPLTKHDRTYRDELLPALVRRIMPDPPRAVDERSPSQDARAVFKVLRAYLRERRARS